MPSPAPLSSAPSSARGGWNSRYTARAKLVLRMKAQLNAQSWPRLQMMVIVALTGLAGLLASASFHKLGLHNMAVRYPLATLVADGALDLVLVAAPSSVDALQAALPPEWSALVPVGSRMARWAAGRAHFCTSASRADDGAPADGFQGSAKRPKTT